MHLADMSLLAPEPELVEPMVPESEQNTSEVLEANPSRAAIRQYLIPPNGKDDAMWQSCCQFGSVSKLSFPWYARTEAHK